MGKSDPKNQNCLFKVACRVQIWRKGIRTIAPEESCPPVRVRVWVRVRVSFRVGGQFSSEAIVLEPEKKHFVKIVTSLVTVLLKMTLCLCIYFVFIKKSLL